MNSLAVSGLAWAPGMLLHALPSIKRLGFAGVEVAPARLGAWEDLSPERLRVWRGEFDAHGLLVPALQGLFHDRPHVALLGEADAFAAMTRHWEVVCRVAAGLGARILGFGAPAHRRRGSLSAYAAAEIGAERVRTLAHMAADSGVHLAIEPVPASDGADFLLTMADAAAFIRRVDHPACGLLFDAGNAKAVGESAALALGLAGRNLLHVHAAEPGHGALADPELHRDAAQALRRRAYTGWITLEIVPAADPLAALSAAGPILHGSYGVGA